MSQISPKFKLRLSLIGSAALLVLVLVWGSIPRGPVVVTPPPSDAEPGRWVHLEGAANTRDAGGYPARDGRFVRRGAIYRSGKLNRLTSDGVREFQNLHANTVVDFCNRLTPWPLFGGDVWGVHLAASVRGCPMSFPGEGDDVDFYTRGVRENAAEYREAFELLADPENYPVLYHCAAGTDRTGVMSALLLSLLGVERETVIADFRLSEQVDRAGSLPAMEALLDRVQSTGGIESFLESIGVTPEIQTRIRETLLADS